MVKEATQLFALVGVCVTAAIGPVYWAYEEAVQIVSGILIFSCEFVGVI